MDNIANLIRAIYCRSKTSITADIRPKRVTQPGEHPSAALHARGVEYIEVRIMDLDPSSSIGMQSSTLYFIDVFLFLLHVTWR